MNRKSSGPDQNGISFHTPPRHYSLPQTANSSLSEKNGINYSSTESMVNDDDEDVIYDPEAATAGQTHRPSMSFLIN
jgi:hypothetical protein